MRIWKYASAHMKRFSIFIMYTWVWRRCLEKHSSKYQYFAYIHGLYINIYIYIFIYKYIYIIFLHIFRCLRNHLSLFTVICFHWQMGSHRSLRCIHSSFLQKVVWLYKSPTNPDSNGKIPSHQKFHTAMSFVANVSPPVFIHLKTPNYSSPCVNSIKTAVIQKISRYINPQKSRKINARNRSWTMCMFSNSHRSKQLVS